MKTNNNIPAYRFQGYTDAWELRKLGEVADFSIKNNSLSRDKLTTDFYDVQNIHYGDILKKFNDVLDVSKTVLPSIIDSNVLDFKDALLLEGDIVFADAAEDTTVGKAVEIRNLNGKDVVSGLHTIVARPKNSFAPFYIGYFINSPAYHNQILPLMQGTKVSSISKSNLQSTYLSYPSNDEQSAIGTFFSTIDRQITLHQRKLDTLKEQKKTYLKLLFPAKGQTQPALRFQGFEDDWEEVKLGEILKERNEQIAENEEYPLMSFVQGVGVTPKGERYDRSFLVKEDNKKYKKTELGDFIYSSNNLETGSIGFNKTGKAVISPVYSIFYSKDEFESSFIGILSQRKDFIAKMIKFRQGVVYGQWRIHENDFLQILLHIPTKAEMEKIITFFQTLDQEIAQVEDKLASLKEMKKTLLRKLFV